MSGGITVKEFKHIPDVNDAEYIKKLEELHEIDKGIISKAVAKIKMLSAQPEYKMGQWIPSDSELEIKCNKCGKDFSEYVYSIDYIFLAEYPKFCPNCGADMRGEENEIN